MRKPFSGLGRFWVVPRLPQSSNFRLEGWAEVESGGAEVGEMRDMDRQEWKLLELEKGYKMIAR
jgi:hypothetical protein